MQKSSCAWDMNKCVWLPLLLGGGDARPLISFLPGIICQLLSLQLLFSGGTRKALKQSCLHMVSASSGSGTMRRQERLGEPLVFPPLLLGGDEMADQAAAKSSQELRNKCALFLGFEKTHTLGNPA